MERSSDPAGASLSWEFACPLCRQALAGGEARCTACGRVYDCAAGIWRFLLPEAAQRYERFLREYRTVRVAEGWGRAESAYYLALPEVAPNDPRRAIWRRRAESYRVLGESIVRPMTAERGRPLMILDIGAGNCWLAHRLAALGHEVAAIDLSLSETDGLGALHWYRTGNTGTGPGFTPIQAEFDHLPLADRQADLAIFNASLHYSPECAVTLREGLRVLRPDGRLVVMDSPVYHDAASGTLMVRERERAFEQAYGFRSNSVPAEHFLTAARLDDLAVRLAVRWEIHTSPGPRSRVQGRWRRWRGQRETAEMPVMSARRV